MIVSPAATSLSASRNARVIGERYMRASILSGSAGVLSRVVVGLVTIVLARTLGPARYGVYALVTSMVGMTSTLTQAGNHVALPKFLPEYSKRDPFHGTAILIHTVAFVTGIVVLVCAALFLSARWIAGQVYHEPALASTFRLAAFLVFATSSFNLASSVVAGLQDFGVFNAAILLRSISLLAFGWIGASILGFRGALGGQLLASLLGFALLLIVGSRLWRRQFNVSGSLTMSLKITREITSLAFPAFLVTALVAPVYWFNDTVLARRAGFSQVGIFGVMLALVQLILLAPTQLSVPGVSFLSEARASLKEEYFRQLVTANLRAIWAVTLPIALGCAIFCPLIVRAFFGSAYLRVSGIAFPMSFAALLMMLDRVLGQVMTASGKMWHRLAIVLAWAVSFSAIALWLIPRRGIVGSAFAFAFSYLLFLICIAWYCYAVFGIPFRPFGRLVALSTLAFVFGGIASRSGVGNIFHPASALLILLVLSLEWFWIFDRSERHTVQCVITRMCKEAVSRVFGVRPAQSSRAAPSANQLEMD